MVAEKALRSLVQFPTTTGNGQPMGGQMGPPQGHGKPGADFTSDGDNTHTLLYSNFEANVIQACGNT